MLPSLKLAFSHLKMDGWNTIFLLGRPIFRGELLVSGRVKIIILFSKVTLDPPLGSCCSIAL